ncbi:MAG: hypothetical protein AB7V50_04860, partial [Vampirovibrionia bacterium]
TGGYNMGVTYQWDFGSNFTGNLNVYLAGCSSLWASNTTDNSGAIWETNIWDAITAVKQTKTLNGSGNVLQLKFWNSGIDEHFVLLSWYINLIERGVR